MSVDLPKLCENVFAVAVTSMDLQRVGVIYAASLGSLMLSQSAAAGHPLTVIDYDLQPVGATLLGPWLPKVFERLDRYAIECRTLHKRHSGLWVEPRGMGGAILETCAKRELRAVNLDGLLERMKLPPKTLDRISAAQSKLHDGQYVKISSQCAENTLQFQGKTTNHLLSQIQGFTPAAIDTLQTELLEALCIAIYVTAEKS